MTRFVQKIMAAAASLKAEGGLSGYVAKNSVRLFLLQCFSLLLGMLLNYVFLKVVDLEVYGTYVFVFNLLNLLATISLLGVDSLLVKVIPVLYAERAFPRLKGVLCFSLALVVGGALVTALFSTRVAFLFGDVRGAVPVNWWLLATLALVTLSGAAVVRSCLQGVKKVLASQVAETLIRPLLLLGVVGFLWRVGGHISLEQLLWLNVAVGGTGLLISGLLLHRSVTPDLRGRTPEYAVRPWLYTSMGFYALSLLHVLSARVDIFLLGQLKGNAEVGVYNIAQRLSDLISFVLTVVNFVTSPLIARLYAEGNILQLQKLVTRSAQAVLAASLPLVLVMVALRKQLLLFFGVDLLQGREALLILCLGQAVNVVCGSVGLLLMQSGHQKWCIVSLVAALAVNLALNFLLTPRHGIVGTAVASAASLAVWNLLMYYFVRKKLKLRTTAFGVV
ncbi:oligosaccharide flippase family protein [Paraflavisolibacter sp. H34]|uniref:oligosaccharide flippase family protein n=1 Tax=Huijunlia imazamoxiresistens TaxID=3127457 RepID=UPI003017955F